MTDTKRPPRKSVTTRIDAKARDIIEHTAWVRRTTASQVARVLLEGAAKQLASEARPA